MITNIDAATQAAIEPLLSAHQNHELDQWEEQLKRTSWVDPLGVLNAPSVRKKIFTSGDTVESFEGWLETLPRWRSRVTVPTSTTTLSDSVLLKSWKRVRQVLADRLLIHRREGTLPIEGGILFFTSNLSHSIVIRYSFSGANVRLEPVGVWKRPRAIFDVWGTITDIDHATRNALKSILTSGHKIVAHRGIVVHVDRRTENNVFGPSIDTLIMAEAVAHTYLPPNNASYKGTEYTRVLDVGSGSGFLGSFIASHMDNIDKVVSVDTAKSSVQCTIRNKEVSVSASEMEDVETDTIHGKFDPDILSGPYDIILCNPPYIPNPGDQSDTITTDYLDAVGGLSLIKTLLRSLDDMLSNDGVAIIMTSSVSNGYIRRAIPDKFTFEPCFPDTDLTVNFDVEAVFERSEWFDELLDSGLVFEHKGDYLHEIEPLIIKR